MYFETSFENRRKKVLVPVIIVTMVHALSSMVFPHVLVTMDMLVITVIVTSVTAKHAVVTVTALLIQITVQTISVIVIMVILEVIALAGFNLTFFERIVRLNMNYVTLF